ncbi:MAG: glutamyl-tRNA reductase [Caldilineaceae bacterium]|nr:glutamyl-tRNA reductase [Caldilineaceae bacterium]
MNINRLICVGLNHQSASIGLREQLSQWPQGDLRTADIAELVIVSTCNRLELYAYVADALPATAEAATLAQPLIQLIAATQALPIATFVDHLYIHYGEAAVHHLCRVAAGLDSLVLGEAQILGQVNTAWQKAQTARMVGPALNLLFRIGVKAGRRARTETNISANAVSVGSAALTLAHQITGSLHQQQILVIGLGEIGQLTLKGLRGRGVTQVALANRTWQRAEALAKQWGGSVYSLAELPSALAAADVVISATSATEPIIDLTILTAVMSRRDQRPLLLIDLAVPRDIDPAVAALPGIQLYDVDALRHSVDCALAARQREMPAVEQIITEVQLEWRQHFQELQVRPVVVELRQKAEQIRQRAVARTLRHLGDVDHQTSDQLNHLSRALVNQLLHEPTLQLKRKAGQQQADLYATLVSDLFGLSHVEDEVDHEVDKEPEATEAPGRAAS